MQRYRQNSGIGKLSRAAADSSRNGGYVIPNNNVQAMRPG